MPNFVEYSVLYLFGLILVFWKIWTVAFMSCCECCIWVSVAERVKSGGRNNKVALDLGALPVQQCQPLLQFCSWLAGLTQFHFISLPEKVPAVADVHTGSHHFVNWAEGVCSLSILPVTSHNRSPRCLEEKKKLVVELTLEWTCRRTAIFYFLLVIKKTKLPSTEELNLNKGIINKASIH